MMFGELLKKLRNEKKLNMDEFVKEINSKYELSISKSMVSRWENGLTDPKMEYVRVIADYFNVSMDYLLEINQPPEWATYKDRRDFKRMLEDEQPIMFDGVPLDDEDKEKIRRVMEAMFWDAKKKNKRKPINDET